MKAHVGLILAAALVFPMMANAYIPPSFFMIRKIVEKKNGVKGLKIVTLVKEIKDKQPTGVQFKQITLYDEKTGILRCWGLDGEDKPRFYQERKLGVTPSGAVLPAPVIDYLLFSSQVVPLAKALIQAGIPVRTEIELKEMKDEEERRAAEQTVLRRWNEGYAWSIGKETNKPQLWVEKDGFLPSRLVIPDEDATKEVDFQFASFHAVGGFLYPYEVTFNTKGVTVLREDVVTVTPNPTHTGGLPILSATGLIEDGAGLTSRVKDLMILYYQNGR